MFSYEKWDRLAAGAGFDPFVVVGARPVIETAGEAVQNGIGMNIAA